MVSPLSWVICKALGKKVEISNMSDVNFFCLKGVLTKNFNTVDLVKTFEKIQKHSNPSGHIDDDIMQNYEQKKVKKGKKSNSMGKTSFFLSTMSFNPWAILAT
jgi:hypothetical protein